MKAGYHGSMTISEIVAMAWPPEIFSRWRPNKKQLGANSEWVMSGDGGQKKLCVQPDSCIPSKDCHIL